jgi:hypothetical protein
MPISPTALKAAAEQSIDIDALLVLIDARLTAYAESNNVDGPFTIHVKRIPNWAVEIICKVYIENCWHNVRQARIADSFVYLEFVP